MTINTEGTFISENNRKNPNQGSIAERLDVLDKIIGQAYDLCLTYVQNTEAVRRISPDAPAENCGIKEMKSEIENRIDKQIDHIESIIRLMEGAKYELRL